MILEFKNRSWNYEFGTQTLFLLWLLAGLPNPGLFYLQPQVSTPDFSTPDFTSLQPWTHLPGPDNGIKKFMAEKSVVQKSRSKNRKNMPTSLMDWPKYDYFFSVMYWSEVEEIPQSKLLLFINFVLVGLICKPSL